MRVRSEKSADDAASFESITKLQAAERQLRLAIRLFFERRDLVAVHTLGAAARGILRVLGLRRGIKGMQDGDFIRPERKQEVDNLFNKAQNFLKHADRDPDGELKFYNQATPLYLLDAAMLYVLLTGQQFPEVTGLLMWSAVKFPDILVKGTPLEKHITDLLSRQKLDPNDFDLILEIIDMHASRRGM